MQRQSRSYLATVTLMLMMLSITCASRSWGQNIDVIGHVYDVEDEGQATVREREPPAHKLFPKKRTQIVSEETIYTNKTNAKAILDAKDGDSSIWSLFHGTTVTFAKAAPACATAADRDVQHVVVDGKSGQIQATYDLGEEIEVTSEAHTENAVICVAGTTYNIIFSPQAKTTAVTSFEGTVLVRNPLAPGNEWTKVEQNQFTRIVGTLPPTKPRKLRVLLSALTTIQLPKASGPPLIPPEIPVHEIYTTRRSPVDTLGTRDIKVTVTLP